MTPSDVRELRVRHDVVQPALSRLGDRLGEPGDGGPVQRAVRRDVVQPAASLGDQHPPAGKECEGPGVMEPAGQHLHAHRVLIGVLDQVRGRARGHGPGEQHGSGDKAQAVHCGGDDPYPAPARARGGAGSRL